MHTISQNCIKMIMSFEGCRLTAYQPSGEDHSKYPLYTIGYGHYGVAKGTIISQTQAESLLKEDVKKYEKLVNKYDHIYAWSQNELDALTCFCFNVGSIDQLTDHGKRSKNDIYMKIPQYCRSGEKILNGLVRRRKVEADLFAKDGLGNTFVNNVTYPTIKKGDKNKFVGILQRMLIAKGYMPSKSDDSIFGSKTFEAVKTYQKDHELMVDGIVGKNTWRSLNE